MKRIHVFDGIKCLGCGVALAEVPVLGDDGMECPGTPVVPVLMLVPAL